MGLCSEEDAQNGIRDVFSYRRSREVIKAAIITVKEPEFLRVHKVTGVPQIRLYKPNGEMLGLPRSNRQCSLFQQHFASPGFCGSPILHFGFQRVPKGVPRSNDEASTAPKGGPRGPAGP